MNLLILDDEPIFVEQMEMIISTNFPNWNLHMAYSGTDALQLLDDQTKAHQPINLALVDIKLLGRSGLEVAEIMKRENPLIDIVIISAFQEFEYARHSIKLKAIDYLVKPVLEIELLNLLNAYIVENPQHNISSNLVNGAIHIIKERFDEPLKLASVADELFVNPQYLSRIFSEETGIPFSEYLLRYRVKMAKYLLVKEKEWSMDHIASSTGFNSQHYFCKVFKKFMMVSPARYRQQQLVK
ncbi:response regulator transcription factor [Planococcus sp. YIM B11945]|uniref:response regulator transcription factor n=1 Tax=Planococcus sp. YIM B11945 TaxID=3435410 RepID=UPI003D7E7B35